MISLLTGSVRSIASDRLVVEVGGFGISVLVNPQTAAQVTLGSQVQLFTSLIVREDSLTLFGFINDESRSLFELVQTVSGIGPKVALSILGALTPEDLGRAISQEDIGAIERVPGIGRKGAQRLILELKGKLSDLSAVQLYKGHQPAWRGPSATTLGGYCAGAVVPRSARILATRKSTTFSISAWPALPTRLPITP